MQKRIASYNLEEIKALIEKERYFVTKSAKLAYVALGLSDEEVVQIIMSLVHRDLHKSMTSYANNKLWQDVYYKNVDELELYIKLQINGDAIIISFKERT